MSGRTVLLSTGYAILALCAGYFIALLWQPSPVVASLAVLLSAATVAVNLYMIHHS